LGHSSSKANIGRFILSEDANAWVCSFCNGPLETLSHIFLDCALAKVLWRSAPWPLNISYFSSRPISEWILIVIYSSDRLAIPAADSRKFQLFAALVMDLIWQFRNKLIHDSILPNLALAIQHLKVSLQSPYFAWQSVALPSLWLPSISGYLKGHFDIAICDNFDVATAVISNSLGEIILAMTQKLSVSDILIGEAFAVLLATRLAASTGTEHFTLEGNALLVILVVNQPHLFSSWHLAPFILDIILNLSSFLNWNALKVSRSANLRAHVLVKWATTHIVFGSIPTRSPILFSLKIKNGKDLPI
jgi:hypothetical protein